MCDLWFSHAQQEFSMKTEIKGNFVELLLLALNYQRASPVWDFLKISSVALLLLINSLLKHMAFVLLALSSLFSTQKESSCLTGPPCLFQLSLLLPCKGGQVTRWPGDQVFKRPISNDKMFKKPKIKICFGFLLAFQERKVHFWKLHLKLLKWSLEFFSS